MITKLYEYNMYYKRIREIRIELTNLNKVFNNKPCKFVIKNKIGRETFKNFEHNDIIYNIEYDNKNFYYKINLQKDDTYIIVKRNEVAFHTIYESITKRIISYGETLSKIITILQKL